jgi:hypothetical protein
MTPAKKIKPTTVEVTMKSVARAKAVEKASHLMMTLSGIVKHAQSAM